MRTETEYYWPAYVDFMTILFFISFAIAGFFFYEYNRTLKAARQYEALVKEVISINDRLKEEFKKKHLQFNPKAKDKIKLKGDFYFDTNKDYLKDLDAQENIVQIGQSIKKVLDKGGDKTKYMILIEGHTDSDGEIEYNNDLSFRRALSIIRIWETSCQLIQPNYEIVPAGFGELNPISDLKEENRRIEISIIPKVSSLYDLLIKQSGQNP